MPNPAFSFFEEICAGLRGHHETVLIDESFTAGTLTDLRRWSAETATPSAFSKALKYLDSHFKSRGSVLPFEYDLETRRFTAVHPAFIDFVSLAQNQRGIGKEADKFEVAISEHLARRLTGIIRRVGFPRKKHKTAREFEKYLTEQLFFRKGVVVGKDRDGGLDIIWLPPLGALPFRALASIQCKNSPYNKAAGFESVGRAQQTLMRHSHAGNPACSLHCVMYNDYIDEKIMEHAKDAGFVPLGLSDLAPLTTPVSLEHL